MSVSPAALRALEQAAKELGDAALSRSGGVLVSGVDTLVAGDYYILAYNPGGNEVKDRLTIAESLAASRGCVRQNGWTEVGEPEPFRGRVKAVFDALGAEPEQVFSTNAVFMRSPSATKLKGPWDLWWNHCWPVHKLFLEIVRPKVVVCLGCGAQESAMEMLRLPERRTGWSYRGLSHWEKVQNEDAKDGKWRPRVGLRLGAGSVHHCAVLGLPHPANSRPGNWIKAGDGWTLSPAAMEKIAQARAAAGREN